MIAMVRLETSQEQGLPHKAWNSDEADGWVVALKKVAISAKRGTVGSREGVFRTKIILLDLKDVWFSLRSCL
jgi:hypothetical protein